VVISGYDGSINIDTKIDTDEFNEGLDEMAKEMEKKFAEMRDSIDDFATQVREGSTTAAEGLTVLQAIIAAIGVGVVIVAALILVAVVAIIAAIAGVIKIMIKSMTALYDLEGYATEVKEAFENLKLAFATAFQPLLSAALPIILVIIQWLTKLLYFIQMVVAAFMGQKQIMIATAGATGAAAGEAGKLAENYREAGEAAKGALASFDELNVLQIEEEKPTAGGGGIPIVFEMIDVDEGIWEVVQNIKQWFADAWLWVSTKAIDAWTWIKETWNTASEWFLMIVALWVEAFTAAWNWISEQAAIAWEWISASAIIAWEWIVEIWGNATTWLYEYVINPYREAFIAVWSFIGILARNAWAVTKWVWSIAKAWFIEHVIDPWTAAFTAAWEWISEQATIAWDWIVEIWGEAVAWYKENILEPLKEAFGKALDWIKEKWTIIFESIREIVIGIINKLITGINTFIGHVLGGVNRVIDALNNLGSVVPGWEIIPNIGIPVIPPLLAMGAVIPPNSPFAAILGDQTFGTNIETPEALLRQIIREEGGGSKDVIIKFEGDLGALVMQLKPFIDQENVRIGRSMLRSAS